MKHFWMCACLLFSTLTVWGQTNFRKSEIKEVMKRVADWQIANPDKRHEHGDLDWTNAALYMGMATVTLSIIVLGYLCLQR